MKKQIKALKKTGNSILAGRSSTPKWVLEMTLWDKSHITPMSWDKGKPNKKKLEDYCKKYNESLEEGEVNEHLGIHAMCVSAFIRENRVGAKPIVSWKMKKVPMFLASVEAGIAGDWIIKDLNFKTFNKKLKAYVMEHVKDIVSVTKQHVPQIGYVWYFKNAKGDNVAMWDKKEGNLRILKGYET